MNEEKEVMEILDSYCYKSVKDRSYGSTDDSDLVIINHGISICDFKAIAKSINNLYQAEIDKLKAENDKLRCIIKSLDLKQMGFIAWDKTLTDEELKLFNSLINQKG
jgi:hypothetical protein